MVETIKTRLREIEAAKFTLSKLEESYNKMLEKLGDELLKGFTPIDSLSIEGLLKVIQDRIEERDGDEVQSL